MSPIRFWLSVSKVYCGLRYGVADSPSWRQEIADSDEYIVCVCRSYVRAGSIQKKFEHGGSESSVKEVVMTLVGEAEQAVVTSVATCIVGAPAAYRQGELGDVFQVVSDCPGVPSSPRDVVVDEDLPLYTAVVVFNGSYARLNFFGYDLQVPGCGFLDERPK